MLTQAFEKPPWLINLIKRIRNIATKGVLTAIVYVLVLFLLSSIAILLMYFALVAAGSTPY